MGIGYME